MLIARESLSCYKIETNNNMG